MKELTKKYSVRISELCFYIFFVSLLSAKGIGLYDGQTLFKVFLIISLLGWGAKFFFTEYTVRELFLCVLPVMLGCVIYLNTGEKGALFCLLLLSGMKGMQVKRVFQTGLVTWILSFGGLFLVTSLHLADSPFKVHDKLGLGRIIRWSLGYAHPNVLHISCLILVCFIVYLTGERFRPRSFVFLMLVNLYVFMYSLSSTGFLAVSFLLSLALYWSFRHKFCRAERIAIQLFLPGCLFLSLAAPVVLEGKAFSFVNKLVNNRLILSKWFLQNQKVQLLGVNTGGLVTSLRTMDNSYVFAWITYGLVFFILATTAYMALIFIKTREQDGVSLCLILACLFAGVTEPFLFNTSFKNITIIFIGAMVFSDQRGEGKSKVPLLGKHDRELVIKLPNVERIGKDMRKAASGYRKKLFAGAVFAGVLAGALCFLSAKMPQRYILPQTAFEETGDLGEIYYLASKEDVPLEGDVILGYKDKDTAMVAFAGNIAKVERFRNTVCWTVITVFSVYGLGMISLWIKSIRVRAVE